MVHEAFDRAAGNGLVARAVLDSGTQIFGQLDRALDSEIEVAILGDILEEPMQIYGREVNRDRVVATVATATASR